jgi:hypothetical protein
VQRYFSPWKYSALFFFQKGFWNTKSDPIFGQIGVVLVIAVPGNKVLESWNGIPACSFKIYPLEICMSELLLMTT